MHLYIPEQTITTEYNAEWSAIDAFSNGHVIINTLNL